MLGEPGLHVGEEVCNDVRVKVSMWATGRPFLNAWSVFWMCGIAFLYVADDMRADFDLICSSAVG
jgi:hypothetical protein